MKLLPTAVLTLSALAPLGATARKSDADNVKTCAKWNPDILKAIDAICTPNLVVPSDHAKKGKTVGKIKVQIKSDCKPKQWVPKNWCAMQFHQICGIEGGILGNPLPGFDKGRGSLKFGKNGCQKFIIKKK